jgi:hypothetical protein
MKETSHTSRNFSKLRNCYVSTIVCLFQGYYYFARSATNFFLSGSRKIWKSFPHIGKVFAKLGQNFGQNLPFSVKIRNNTNSLAWA